MQYSAKDITLIDSLFPGLTRCVLTTHTLIPPYDSARHAQKLLLQHAQIVEK